MQLPRQSRLPEVPPSRVAAAVLAGDCDSPTAMARTNTDPTLTEAVATVSLGSTGGMPTLPAPLVMPRRQADAPADSEEAADTSEAIAAILSAGADIQSAELEIFAPKVEAVWTVLQHQYASRITAAEVDHLFACFVFGLTSPSYAGREPARHFDACRSLVAMQLPKDRAEAALHSVPQPTQPWVESARDLIEGKGIAMGRALEAEAHPAKDFSAAQANSAAMERLVRHEGDVNDGMHRGEVRSRIRR